MNDLDDVSYYKVEPEDPTEKIKKKIEYWSEKWLERDAITQDVADFVLNLADTKPGNVKPLYKTHKPQPWPIRLLLSGTNTPVQPLSKFVQYNIRHLPAHLPNQILDTKEFLQKIQKINQTLAPLPPTSTLVICDVTKLYPSVNNVMGVPAVQDLLSMFPSPYTPLTECVIEALKICLECNVCKFTTADGQTHLRMPCRGTAMGPSHACDYVDVFMGDLDKRTIHDSPVPLLSSLLPIENREEHSSLDWSRFRDDGITVLLQPAHTALFEDHLQSLHPDIHWEVSSGKSMNYLNLTVKLEDGYIQTDEYSKSSHNYLPPNSCHPPSTFKGLIASKGTQLRVNCSKSSFLQPRLKEYAEYFSACGWNYDKAYGDLVKGAKFVKGESEDEAATKRMEIINKPRKKKPKKLAWVSKWDPRAPDKSKIIHNNLHLLYRNNENKKIFPKEMLIASNRRRPNLGEFIKPTVPRRFLPHGPYLEPGSYPCEGKDVLPCRKGACDLCKHIQPTRSIKSPWDQRSWKIRGHHTCEEKNLVYLIFCTHSDHKDSSWYVGSAKDMRARWRNHRSDFIGKKSTKSGLANHSTLAHPEVAKSQPIPYLNVVLLESVEKEEDLLRRELWWQNNIGTLFIGLNKRKDTRTVSMQKKRIAF
jgi:hypothetical protein